MNDNDFVDLPVALPSAAAGQDDTLLSMFTALIMRAPKRYRISTSDSWPVAALMLAPADLDGLVFIGYGSHRALVATGDTLRLLDLGRGYLRVTVAGPDEKAVAGALRKLREHYPHVRPEDGPTVPMVFWALGDHGPMMFRRDVMVPTWETVRLNYSERVRETLEPLITWRVPAVGGQLLLWYGPPGTGKTWAIRALASEWRQWCQFEYVADPDKLFDRASYLTQVLLDPKEEEEEGRPPRWRCLILEDTGELLMTDAKLQQGQALSRLLNVVDGLLGQGLRLLILITTNEEVKTLHPAVTRPGRCLYQVTFHSFPILEANRWMEQHGHASRNNGTAAMTLAELYQRAEQFPVQRPVVSRVGF
jgi:hypothetical protein